MTNFYPSIRTFNISDMHWCDLGKCVVYFQFEDEDIASGEADGKYRLVYADAFITVEDSNPELGWRNDILDFKLVA